MFFVCVCVCVCTRAGMCVCVFVCTCVCVCKYCMYNHSLKLSKIFYTENCQSTEEYAAWTNVTHKAKCICGIL